MNTAIAETRVAWQRATLAAIASLLCTAWSSTAVSLQAAEARNLALHKPASSSSIENDDHNAARANDGNAKTYWCADDEPEGGPEWWQVDLEKAVDLTGGEIRWPYGGKNYRYKVEGSIDAKNWLPLSDQTDNRVKSQVHDLKFANARPARYVRITITSFDEGCWASISEVKLFGSEHSQ